MSEEVKNTPLYDWHVANGARMVPFAGWNMPVQYSEGILAEHHHTREQVSLFDICHMGEFRVKGTGALEALDAILARPIMDQKIGVCRYNFLLNENAMVMDDLIVYRMDEDEFFIVVNAGTRAGDAEQFRNNLPAGISFVDESDATAKIDLQGPGSAKVLLGLGFKPEELPGYFKWIETEIHGIPCLLSRTGYTGELGFEIYFDASKAVEMWEFFIAQENVKPAGLGARDTLRLEMAYALYGHELNLETTPVEAGFGPMLKLEKLPEREFIGGKALRNAKSRKNLVCIELEGRRAAREGAEVFNAAGEVVGKVTSGAFSPSLGVAIAMAYIDAGQEIQIGTGLQLAAGRKTIPGKIVELPFYKGGSVREKI